MKNQWELCNMTESVSFSSLSVCLSVCPSLQRQKVKLKKTNFLCFLVLSQIYNSRSFLKHICRKFWKAILYWTVKNNTCFMFALCLVNISITSIRNNHFHNPKKKRRESMFLVLMQRASWTSQLVCCVCWPSACCVWRSRRSCDWNLL